ncbi:MAG: anti-sigma factor [Bacilli bacterium]|nr:anti-sigma factor [Bacilli bacterium]
MSTNKMKLVFKSLSENESFARVAVAAFVSQLDPTMEEITEIKTVVSEAVTNAIIHGYEGKIGEVEISCSIDQDRIELIFSDQGKGISDLEEARQPLYTSKPELERSGMGFTIMESFMDDIEVTSEVGSGTQVRLVKRLKSRQLETH